MTIHLRFQHCFYVCAFFLASTSLGFGQQPVAIQEAPLVLPTYEIGPPDLEPMFYAGRDYQGAQGAIYPYGLYDNLLDVKGNKTYKADFVENQYVKICVLPELGGRILSATDKTDGYDYVYRQTASPIAVGGRIVVPVGSYVQGVISHVKRSGRVAGRAELSIRLDTLTLPSGKALQFSPHLSSVDSNDTGQKVVGEDNTVKQGPNRGKDAARIAILAGHGAAIGGIADRSWRGAGIGAGAGSAVGLATVLLGRGSEVQLRQGNTLDVVFDRPVTLE